MTAYDLISQYFRDAIDPPDGSAIAAAAQLDALRLRLLPLVWPLKILMLTEGERAELAGKDPCRQRDRSRACARFLARRPHFAQLSGVDALVLQTVIAKDDSLDLLWATLGQLLAVAKDGVLTMSGGLSQQVAAVLSFAQGALARRDTPPKLLDEVYLWFAPLLLAAAERNKRLSAKRLKKVTDQRNDRADDLPEHHAAAGSKRRGRKRGAQPGLVGRVIKSGPWRDIQSGWLDEFLSVPAEADVAAAQGLAQVVAQSGIELLNTDLRRRTSLWVDHGALWLSTRVGEALSQAPLLSAAVGISGAEILRRRAQLAALYNLEDALGLAQLTVDGGRRVLQVWQWEANVALGAALLDALKDAAVDHQDLLGDANEVLNQIETLVQQRRATRQKNAEAVAAEKTQVAQAQKQVLLMQTMRDIREGKEVDPQVQRAMAVYYAELMGE